TSSALNGRRRRGVSCRRGERLQFWRGLGTKGNRRIGPMRRAKNLHAERANARRVETDAENHRRTARLVPAVTSGGLEIRTGRGPGARRSGGRATDCAEPHERLRGQRRRLWRRLWSGDGRGEMRAPGGCAGALPGPGRMDGLLIFGGFELPALREPPPHPAYGHPLPHWGRGTG